MECVAAEMLSFCISAQAGWHPLLAQDANNRRAKLINKVYEEKLPKNERVFKAAIFAKVRFRYRTDQTTRKEESNFVVFIDRIVSNTIILLLKKRKINTLALIVTKKTNVK